MSDYNIDWSKAPEGCNMVYILDYDNWRDDVPIYTSHWEKLLEDGTVYDWIDNGWSYWDDVSGIDKSARVMRPEVNEVKPSSQYSVNDKVKITKQEIHFLKVGSIATIERIESIGEGDFPEGLLYTLSGVNYNNYPVIQQTGSDEFELYVEEVTEAPKTEISAKSEITVVIDLEGTSYSLTREAARKQYKDLKKIFKEEIR